MTIPEGSLRLARRGGGARAVFTAVMALGLSACGPPSGTDPVYLALKANPPTEIPARHLPKLRRNIPSCDKPSEGGSVGSMLCWWPSRRSDPHVAMLTYYDRSVLPSSVRLSAPGGEPISDYPPIK